MAISLENGFALGNFDFANLFFGLANSLGSNPVPGPGAWRLACGRRAAIGLHRCIIPGFAPIGKAFASRRNAGQEAGALYTVPRSVFPCVSAVTTTMTMA